MSAFNVLRAGALSFMFILSALGGFAHGAAYPLRDTAIDESKARSGNVSEPFGLPTSMLADGPLRAKWEAVERAITAESGIIAACANDPGHCASQPALRFLEIVKMASGREGLARFGEINRAFNLAIRPVAIRCRGLLVVTAGHAGGGSWRLRGLCDCQACCAARRRRRGRGSSPPDHSRNRDRRRPRGGRGPVRRTLAGA